MSESVKARYAHPDGLTRLAYSPSGKFLFSVGTNQIIRKFFVDEPDREPDSIENHQDAITGVATTEGQFITCSEDATVSLFNSETNEFDRLVVRTTLPVRDIAVDRSETWVAVASE